MLGHLWQHPDDGFERPAKGMADLVPGPLRLARDRAGLATYLQSGPQVLSEVSKFAFLNRREPYASLLGV